MKIAQIAPPWFAVPPLDYGGVELIVSLLADGLSTQGHDVTLFPSAGSQTRAELVTPPRACRDRVRRHCSAETMVAGYERIFEQVVNPT